MFTQILTYFKHSNMFFGLSDTKISPVPNDMRESFPILVLFSKNTDYLIYLNPIQLTEVPTESMENFIEMNFDLSSNIAYFDGTHCSPNGNKKLWICQCCLAGETGCTNEMGGDVATSTGNVLNLKTYSPF